MTVEEREEAPAGAPTPPPTEAVWIPVRSELRRWLQRNAPSLAELYEGAVHMVYERSLPGRVRLVSHAVREIRNRLPDAISGVKGGTKLDYKGRLDRISQVWERQGYALDGSLPGASLSENPTADAPAEIPIPRQLLRLIADLVKDHGATREKPLDAAIRLFEGCAPENQHLPETIRPLALHWISVTDWFVERVHDSEKVDADICDITELRERFELFEATLRALVGSFFATLDELDEILEDTNA